MPAWRSLSTWVLAEQPEHDSCPLHAHTPLAFCSDGCEGCVMQAVGFLACFVLFLVPACIYRPLTGSTTGTKVFQFIYFFSSFWNQFGPNCTTFLVAGEHPAVPAVHALHDVSALLDVLFVV